MSDDAILISIIIGIIFAFILINLVPPIWVLLSRRSHGGAKFGWFLVSFIFSWLGLAIFLIVTQPINLMESSTPKQTIFDVWRPRTADIVSARKAAMSGFWAALVVAIITFVFTLLDWSHSNKVVLVFVALYALIAFGIFKMSRIAAVSGLVLYVADRVWGWPQLGAQGYRVVVIIASIILVLLFINGVRGTVVFHKLKKNAE